MSNFFSNNDSETDNLFAKAENSSEKNFFSSADSEEKEEKPKDNSLQGQYKEIKDNYKQIFMEAVISIRKELETLKPENPCESCSHKDCKIAKKDIFAPYPTAGCKLREWQMQAVTYLTGDYRQKLIHAHKEIMDKRSEYECNKCGDCCKLAVSEYSYTQLKQRAMKGDKSSEEFISIFVPFETEEEARKINPEYFDLLNILVEDEKIYYYYCPKVDDCNLCTIYEQRPAICKEFPYNPLRLLPSKCSYNAWKNEISHQAQLLKAKFDLIEFYKQKLGG